MWCLTYQVADGKAQISELQNHKNSFKKKRENRFMRDISCVPYSILNSYVGLNGFTDMKGT